MLLAKRIHLPGSSWGVTSIFNIPFSFQGPFPWSPVWAVRSLG